MPPAKKTSTAKPSKASPQRGAKKASGRKNTSKRALRIKKILVPIDFSQSSVQALRFACRYAEFYEASLILMHVNPVVLSPDVKHSLKRKESAMLQEKVREQLAAIHRKERKRDLPMESVVANGVPYREIVDAARKWKADLIVISTHGHTGLAHVMLGSTAERVVRDAPCPVITVHQKLLEQNGARFAPGRIKKILVPTDFSKASRATIRKALQFARQQGASVDLLHVSEPLVYPEYPEFGYVDVQLLTEQLTDSAEKQLQKIRNQSRDSDLISTALVREGIPFKEIVAYAKESKADLVVTSTHGRSGFLGALLGSTSERIVQHAPCPVLIFRQS